MKKIRPQASGCRSPLPMQRFANIAADRDRSQNCRRQLTPLHLDDQAPRLSKCSVAPCVPLVGLTGAAESMHRSSPCKY